MPRNPTLDLLKQSGRTDPGPAIQRLMHEKNLTHDQLAQYLKDSKGKPLTRHAVTAALRRPFGMVRHIDKVAKVLNTSPEALLGAAPAKMELPPLPDAPTASALAAPFEYLFNASPEDTEIALSPGCKIIQVGETLALCGPLAAAPRAGDLVLVKTKDGRTHLRHFYPDSSEPTRMVLASGDTQEPVIVLEAKQVAELRLAFGSVNLIGR